MDLEASLGSLPPLREVISEHNLRAEKKLGQNFLLDQNITDKIARTAGDLTGATVFEIGPGPGGLTRSLLRAGAAKVIAIEFDPRAVEALQSLKEASGGRLEVLLQDALQTNLLDLADTGPRKIVANLPYNIATPLLIGWLKQIRADQHAYDSMTLMFQREVGDRIVAPCGGKAYGRLAVMSQWLCQAKIVYDLPPQAFPPPPKVKSAVVHLTPKVPEENAPAFDKMEALVAAAFGQRRKMIRSSLKGYEAAVGAAGIDNTQRAETLQISDYIEIAQQHS